MVDPRSVSTVLVTGGSGFIGRGLIKELLARGDKVTVLTRDARRAQAAMPQVRALPWNPLEEGPWVEELETVDAVIHLAGEPIAKRWTDQVKREIDQSRAESTRMIVEAIGKCSRKPSVFLCASAVGYYGPQPGNVAFDEDAPPGDGFLANVVVRWEQAAREVEEKHGVRSVQLRIGIVVGEGGGALEKMVMQFKLFAGGPIGAGNQVISWIHMDDVVGLTMLAMDNETVRGPFNVVSPNPTTGEELARAMGEVLGRPSWIRVPEAMLRLGLGDAAEILTTGQRVVPRRALDLGYVFKHPQLETALESALL